jgi:hypothetical protein
MPDQDHSFVPLDCSSASSTCHRNMADVTIQLPQGGWIDGSPADVCSRRMRLFFERPNCPMRSQGAPAGSRHHGHWIAQTAVDTAPGVILLPAPPWHLLCSGPVTGHYLVIRPVATQAGGAVSCRRPLASASACARPRPGCFGAGGDPQAAGRSPLPARYELSVRLARSLRRAVDARPCPGVMMACHHPKPLAY